MSVFSNSNTISVAIVESDDPQTDSESIESDPPYPGTDEGADYSGDLDISDGEDVTINPESRAEPTVDRNEERTEQAGSSSERRDVAPVTGKRTYTYINRIQKTPRATNMRKKWKQDIDALIDGIEGLECCKKLACFKSCNTSFLRNKMRLVREMSYDGRRLSLSEMMGSGGAFYFDGKRVCNIFLKKAFCFSPDLISSVRHGTSKSRQPAQAESFGSGIESQTTSNSDRGPLQKDAIITCLERMAESSGDKMPDQDEIHLPYFRKRDVYAYFKNEFKLLHPPTIKCPSASYFYTTWKTYCRTFKVRKLGRFAKCSTCEQLRKSISDSVSRRDHKSLAIFRRRKAEHNELIAKERREYKKKRDKSRLQPDQFLSIIVDGADQSAFGLPHFMVKTKDDRGHSIKVRLIGLLEHNQQNRLHLFTLTEEYPTGANHVIESIHRFLTERVNQSDLPRTFYIQVDNCTKENKNRFFFSYIECLIRWKLFDEIVVSFLPVGHTHEDIDQTFSRTSERLRSNDAITLADLHTELRTVYNDKTSVVSMNNVINWSGLCEREKCLTNIKNFSKFRYFKFYRLDSSESISCMIRVNTTDEWINIKSLSPRSTTGSFTKFTPDLRNTPPLQIKCPEGKDKVTDCITAAESRIPSVEKVDSLLALRDKVFRDREEELHWDLSNCVELNLTGLIREDEEVVDTQSDEIQPVSLPVVHNQVNNDYRYDLNSFVAVKTDEQSCKFWVAKINSVHRNDENIISGLTVHWFDIDDANDIFTCRYFPSYNNVKARKASQRTPMKDKISVNSVIINFSNLTKMNKLPASVAQHLRSI